MYEPQLTLQGRVASEPRITNVGGANVASMRVCVAPRKYDRKTNEWRDGGAFFVTLRCWRQLADNMCQSFEVGQPLIAAGRLNVRTFVDDRGQRRMSVDFEATSIGHDLNFGHTKFNSAKKQVDQQRAMQRAADDTTDWAYTDGEFAEEIEDGTARPHDVSARGRDDSARAQEEPVTARDESESPWAPGFGRAAEDREQEGEEDSGEGRLMRAA